MKDRSRGFRILVEKRWREQLLLSGWRSHSGWFRPVKKRRERVKRVRLSLRYIVHRVGDIKGETVVCGLVLILGINDSATSYLEERN